MQTFFQQLTFAFFLTNILFLNRIEGMEIDVNDNFPHELVMSVLEEKILHKALEYATAPKDEVDQKVEIIQGEQLLSENNKKGYPLYAIIKITFFSNNPTEDDLTKDIFALIQSRSPLFSRKNNAVLSEDDLNYGLITHIPLDYHTEAERLVGPAKGYTQDFQVVAKYYDVKRFKDIEKRYAATQNSSVPQSIEPYSEYNNQIKEVGATPLRPELKD